MSSLLNRAADSIHALAKRAGVNESVITGLNPVEYDPTNVSHHDQKPVLTLAHHRLHHPNRHHPPLHSRLGICLFVRKAAQSHRRGRRRCHSWSHRHGSYTEFLRLDLPQTLHVEP